MKKIVLAAMVMMTMAGSANAEVSAWDYFWGTSVAEGLDPKLNGWDYFWGSCQNPNEKQLMCATTVVVGITGVIALPVLILTGTSAIITLPSMFAGVAL